MSIYKLTGLSVAALLGLVACQVTDLQPQTALSETTAFQTPERIELAVAGVYDGAQSGIYASGQVRGYTFGGAHLQQGDMRAEDMANVAAFYQITYRSLYDASTPNNGFYWQSTYRMINRANVVLAGLETAQPTAALSQSAIDAYKAECRLLRAMGHHYLLVNFARPFGDNPTTNLGVPYRTLAVTGGASVDQAVQQPRNTVAECYNLLLQDLDYAEANLPTTPRIRPGTTAALPTLTRATRGAAIALKMRVRLHQGNWAAVITEGNKLIPAAAPFVSPVGGYRLTDSPLGAFQAANKGNTESIFSIENNDVDNAGANGGPAQMFMAAAQGGRGLIAISPILWNQPFFPAADLRKSVTAGAVFQDVANGGRYYSRKYTDVTNSTDNAPVLRYAEVLLNMAEALARTTPNDPRALALLSAVRNRANTLPANQYTTASFTTGNDLIRAVINERRPEFMAEGMRWLDVHRLATDATFRQSAGIPAKASDAISTTVWPTIYTGNSATTFTLLPEIAYSDRRFVWPLPQEEIVNNPTLARQQNPEY
jgi:starch-binding outer membrane protein, SusD/RagB family